MASRKEQKEQARAARIAQQEEAAAKAQRTRRMQIFGGAIAIAVIVIVVAVVISTSGGGGGGNTINRNSSEAKAAVTHVDSLLAGIPETGNTLGNPNAKVTITEYGDLECSICDELAAPSSFKNPEGESGTGWEDQLITNYVRTGKAKLVFKSLETASSGNPDQNAFEQQQVAAEAAGLQNKAWYYIELMYNQQGAEGANYVTDGYLQGLAKQIKGLNFTMWMADRKLASLQSQVSAENTAGTKVDGGSASTPTVVISGPKGAVQPIIGLPTSGYTGYTSAISTVS